MGAANCNEAPLCFNGRKRNAIGSRFGGVDLILPCLGRSLVWAHPRNYPGFDRIAIQYLKRLWTLVVTLKADASCFGVTVANGLRYAGMPFSKSL